MVAESEVVGQAITALVVQAMAVVLAQAITALAEATALVAALLSEEVASTVEVVEDTINLVGPAPLIALPQAAHLQAIHPVHTVGICMKKGDV